MLLLSKQALICYLEKHEPSFEWKVSLRTTALSMLHAFTSLKRLPAVRSLNIIFTTSEVYNKLYLHFTLAG